MTHRTIVIDGHSLIYTDEGPPDAPAVLMVHGWFSHRGVWANTIAALRDQRRCIALDLLGFGDSAKPRDGDYSIAAQGRRVLALADSLGIERFVLVGHSMGGQIALNIAATLAPARVTALVDVAGVVSARLMPIPERVTYPALAFMRYAPFLGPVMRWSVRYRWGARQNFGIWFHDFDSVPFESWEVDRRMAFQPGIIEPAYRAGQAIHAANLEATLPRITAPTLVVFGAEDQVVPVEDGHLAQAKIPGSRLHLIEACGHFPMYEKPEAYLAAVRPFLLER